MTGAGDVQKLREVTGAGVMDCKRALEDASGDFGRAANLIRERGLVKAESKKERAVRAGIIESYVHNGRVGALLVLHCETDFVAKSDPFRELAHSLIMQIVAMDPEDVPALMEQNYIKDGSRMVEELVKETIAKTGENIEIEKFIRYTI